MKNVFLGLSLALPLFASAFVLGSTLSDHGDWTQEVKDAMQLYKSDDGFIRNLSLNAIVQFQVSALQPNGSNGLHLKDGAGPVNQEFRRVWLGLNMDMATNTSFHTYWKIGGLPVRESYPSGSMKKNYSYAGIFNFYLKQRFDGVEGLSISAGKFKTLFTDEYITSNTAIKTIERSVLANQNLLESNWGLEARYEPVKNRYVFVQLLANDRAATSKMMQHGDVYRDGRGLKGEFGWEDKCFAVLGAAYRFNESVGRYQQVSAQYAHDFNNVYDGAREPGANSYGLNAKDALSLGHLWVWDKWQFSTAIVSNFEMLYADKQGGSGKNLGWSWMPSYALNKRVEFVGRYVGMTGKGACFLGADRYICTQTTSDSWVDSMHSFYLGANFSYSEMNPNAAKLMMGMEYTMARRKGEAVYRGWTYSSAIRFFF